MFVELSNKVLFPPNITCNMTGILCFTLKTYESVFVTSLHELTFFESTFVSRLTKSDFREPVNIGSDEMVSMNEMAEIVLSFENKKLPIHHIPGPEGVRGRNSDNTLIKEKLGWAPTMKLKVLIEQQFTSLFVRFLITLNFVLRKVTYNSNVIV